jgi:hypothetical protein
MAGGLESDKDRDDGKSGDRGGEPEQKLAEAGSAIGTGRRGRAGGPYLCLHLRLRRRCGPGFHSSLPECSLGTVSGRIAKSARGVTKFS